MSETQDKTDRKYDPANRTEGRWELIVLMNLSLTDDDEGENTGEEQSGRGRGNIINEAKL